MKRFFILMFGVIFATSSIHSQTVQRTWTEDFDGTTALTVKMTPSGSWVSNPVYYLPGSSATNPQSYWGAVPNTIGSTVILETQEYDFTGMVYVTLQFSHICKISPQDTVLIQYRETGSSLWKNLPSHVYRGSAANFNRGFSAASYPEWEAGDSTVIPDQSWWKEESFDLSEDLQHGLFTFRFVIKKGQVQGTQVSYGWLLENVKVLASPYLLYLPTVEFIDPLVPDSVGATGPWEITAKVATRTKAPVETPLLVYTTNGATPQRDTILMTPVTGDSIWQASIPKLLLGTKVTYWVIGRDTTGNMASDTSEYLITKVAVGDVIIGTGTSTSAFSPFYGTYDRSWTRAIYYDWEINPYKKGGQITSIAYNSSQSASLQLDRLSMYVKVTSDIAFTNTDYVDPQTDGATLVFGQASHTIMQGWNEFTFDTPFDLPPGQHLKIYWLNDDGVWSASKTGYFYYTTQPVNNHVYAYGDSPATFPTLPNKSLNGSRPNIKVGIIPFDQGNNSVSLSSIDMSDTVMVSQGGSVPVVATIKNEGNLNLNSVRLSYSVNGGVVVSADIHLTPSLPWDYIVQQTLVPYVPSVNKYDTIKVWASLPNGQNDPLKLDDTLTKIIYGSSDLILEFVTTPADTVSNTGPFEISARIVSYSGTAIGAVSLDVDTTCVGTPTSFILPMTYDAGSGLYKTAIPHTLFGSDVNYSITLTDKLGNVVKTGKSFYINRPERGDDTNSVALVSINTPEDGGFIVGQNIPIQVTIRNMGISNLTSCKLEWMKNGQPQTSFNWTGNLPEDFTQTVVVYPNYTSSGLGQYDTVSVKVSMPNNEEDSVLTDDSLAVVTLGCAGDLYGIKLVDSTAGDFVSIANAITAIRNCNLNGDLTLQLKGVYKESINLSDITPYMKGYRLTITSVDNDADSAVIQPASSAGITLRNTKNITIKAITVNNATGTSSGIQFTAACSNIVIRDCKIFTNPTATASSAAPIRKASNTGNVDSIVVVNNILDGTYAGFYFYGGTESQYGTHVVFDSNTLTNNYAYGMRVYYADFLHISHNTLRSRDTNSTQRWDGLSLQYVNGDIIGNRIIQRNPTVPMDGFNLGYYNYYHTNKRALIANNELIYQVESEKGTGLYSYWVKADFVHNTFYMTSGGEINGLYLESVANSYLSIKNNNIVTSAGSGDLFKYMGNNAMNQYDIDYNNFYPMSQSHIGTFNGTQITTLARWLQYFPNATHMVVLQPAFVDISENTDLMVTNTGLYCPALPNITQDIAGKPRTGQATMGAYQIIPYQLDLGINQILSWNTEVVKDQTVSVDIEIQNSGVDNIQNAVFRWSLNGQIQQTPVPWTPATPQPFLGKDTIAIGSFTVDVASAYTVEVWIESVNNTVDMYHRNDTVRAITANMPLAEWAAPFVEDTICTLTFDVNARIRTQTGAPLSPPELTIVTIINDKYSVYDTLPMQLNNGIWQVNFPQQYYGSKVIYSLEVSDNEGNTLIITDSVYIRLENFAVINPNLTIGTGTNTTGNNPYYYFYHYSNTRNYYMDYEIDTQRRGGYIRSIAFHANSISSVNNISFYLKATTDSTESGTGYLDPITDGATLVWGSATSTTIQGWNVFVLNAPFYLPPYKNLLVYCNNEDGHYLDNGTTSWSCTTQPVERSYYGYSDGGFPAITNQFYSAVRPNIQLDIYGSTPYSGNNLAVMEMLNPVNDLNDLCTPDYSPVRTVIRNMGENDYDFTQDSVVVHMEVINSLGTKSEVSLVLNTDTLVSGESDTLELMSALPIMYSGSYNIKIWIEKSPIDNIVYDDTLRYEFISGRIGLPVDVDFSASTLPLQLVSSRILGANLWTPYTPNVNDTVQPNPGNGTGVLRFDGTAGSMTLLSTRQLDLYGSDQPQLEFWYYHDTTLPFTDASYLDVNALVGSVPVDLAYVLHRSETIHGWHKYTIPLTQFTGTSQCILIQFEAMNKYAGTQYIDRIRITAKQDIAVTGVLADYPACDLNNKEWKVILTNKTAPVLDYSNTPVNLMLEITGTSYTFTKTLQLGTLEGFTSDTILLSPSFNFTKGTYQVKAYLTTPLDDNAVNDTIVTSVVLNPHLRVSTEKLSGNGVNCLSFGTDAYQTATIYNDGNMDLSNIGLTLQIDTGASGSTYIVLQESEMNILNQGDSIVHSFAPYKVPVCKDYQVRIMASLLCEPTLINDAIAVEEECVDMDDLELVNIENPSSEKDKEGDEIKVRINVYNHSDIKPFLNTPVTIQVKNAQGAQTAFFTEYIDVVNTLSTKNYEFRIPYTVPNGIEYSLTVFLTSSENYPHNDTITDIREIDEVGIESLESTNGFTLGQNIPNPAKNITRVDYSIPEAGEVIFHVHTISGQLLYSQTIKAPSGTNSLELNTSTFAAGLYYYSIEYKGQKRVKQLGIVK